MQSAASCSVSLVPSIVTTAYITNTKKATPAPEEKEFILLTFDIDNIFPTHFCRSLTADQFHFRVASDQRNRSRVGRILKARGQV